jgi:hypothetical protein
MSPIPEWLLPHILSLICPVSVCGAAQTESPLMEQNIPIAKMRFM